MTEMGPTRKKNQRSLGVAHSKGAAPKTRAFRQADLPGHLCELRRPRGEDAKCRRAKRPLCSREEGGSSSFSWGARQKGFFGLLLAFPV